jgi:ribose transport system permease protein
MQAGRDNSPGRPAAQSRSLRRVRNLVLRPEAGLPFILVGLCIYLGFASEYFWRWKNILNITEAVSVVGIAAAFATVVVISGGLELTPIAVITMTGIVASEGFQAGLPVWLVVIIALLAAAGIGMVNGSLIAFLNLNAFIVTLGTTFLFTGVAFLITDGTPRDIEAEGFNQLGQARIWFEIPIDTVWMLAVFAATFFILRFTRFGTHVFAVGGGQNAARLSGVRVVHVKLLVYVLAGFVSGIAGIVQTANAGQVGVYAVSNSNDLLVIIAAVIIGGTALTGGKGSVIGTLVGVLLLGVIQNGLTLLNISSFWQPVVVGLILLIAIVLDEVRRRVELATA